MNYTDTKDSHSISITSESEFTSGYERPDNKVENIENDFYVTGNQGELKNYFRRLPLEVKIIENNEIDLKSRKSIIVKHYLEVFLTAFERILLSTRILYKSSNNFPPIIIKWLNDNSVLIEWIYRDFRIGFSIEPQVKESSWYIVSNKNLEEYSASGNINFYNINEIIGNILIFAFKNS